MWSRRAIGRIFIAAGCAPIAYAEPSKAELPLVLKDLLMPGYKLYQKVDPANTANKKFYVAGVLPSGADSVVAFQGAQLFDLRSGEDSGDSATEHSRVISVFKYYEEQAARLGGRRLNTGFDASAWTDINAHLHVYSRPSANGEILYGLWIQDGGRTHWLMLFPSTDARTVAVSAELKARITNFGHAPIYIQFDTNKADLKSDGLEAVRQIAAMMKASPELQLAIEGHTDNVGQAADNLKLSTARAEAVMRAVYAQGISPGRLSAKGRGAGQPVADNGSESGRALNRRVELVKRS